MLSQREQATIQLRAIINANRARRALDLRHAEWVDVFDAIDKLGVLLFFAPLRSLCGAYMPKTPDSNVAGIVVSTNYPVSVQRLTAAHELGHYWMRHAPSLDQESESDLVMRATTGVRVRDAHADPAQEIAAETFAAHFLMPKSKILARMSSLGLDRIKLREENGVYEMSLWFGVSYLAMVWHLVSLKLISYAEATRLAKTKPKEIKRALAGNFALPNWQNDVWPLVRSDSGAVVHARVGDALAITLPSHADGGYLWEQADKQPGLEVVRVEPAPNDEMVDRARRREGFLAGYAPPQQALVRVTGDGALALRLSEQLPWLPSESADSFAVTVVAHGVSERGLLPRIRRRHLELALE